MNFEYTSSKTQDTRPEHEAGLGVIRTYTGININILDPKAEDVCIEDIAHALSQQCRFAGHTSRFYSVAEHSLLCSSMAPRRHALAALLHDASEAYLVDIPTPIKRLMPEYYKAEFRLMEVIAEKFGFTYPLAAEVDLIDKQLLQIEWESLMLSHAAPTILPNSIPGMFLERFDMLNPYTNQAQRISKNAQRIKSYSLINNYTK